MRHPDWELRLHEVIEHARSRPFQWGVNDCYTLGCDAVRAVTGRDLSLYRGMYRSREEAQAIVSREGGIVAATTRQLGPRAPHRRWLRTGDIALIACDNGGHGFGVVEGMRVLAQSLTEQRIASLTRECIVIGWRVC